MQLYPHRVAMFVEVVWGKKTYNKFFRKTLNLPPNTSTVYDGQHYIKLSDPTWRVAEQDFLVFGNLEYIGYFTMTEVENDLVNLGWEAV